MQYTDKSSGYVAIGFAIFIFVTATSTLAAIPTKSQIFDKQAVLAEFTFAKEEDIILLPVTFRGEQHLFIFDTGCSRVAFDNSFRSVLGEVKRAETSNTYFESPTTVEVFNAPEILLGPINMDECGEVICIDLKRVTLALGKKVDGIIGMNFLRKYTIQIDFGEGKLSFLKPKECKNTNWGEQLPLKYNPGGIPCVKGDIANGGQTYFMIDTGATTEKSLESKVFKNIQLYKEAHKLTNESNNNGLWSSPKEEIRISTLSLGPLNYKDLIFDECKVSFLGTPFLSRHIVIFDFPHNAIYLKRGPGLERTDEADMSGLHLIRVSDETIVHSVDEGSPAQKAGIQAKDVVLKINDKDVAAYSRWELSRLKKSGDKNKVTLVVKRQNDVNEISFALQRRI